MKYKVGDTVAFDVPIEARGKAQGARSGRQRFTIGLITALLEESESYQIAALVGKAYIIREAEISGRADIPPVLGSGTVGVQHRAGSYY